MSNVDIRMSGGTHQLLIQPGRRVHLTEFRRVAPRMPPKFCTVLRKYLRDRRVISVKQHELDRIVIIEIGDEESSHKLVAELFGNGNLLLLDPQNKIFVAKQYRRMRDRDVIPKAIYEFPPPRGVDVLTQDNHSMTELLADSKANVVRTLTSRLNLDSLSCQEICALSGVQSTSKVSGLDAQAMADLDEGLKQFTSKLRVGVNKPRIITEIDPDETDFEPEPVAFVPFEFEIYRDLSVDTFDTFSLAIDEYYGVSESEQEDEVEKTAHDKEKERLQKIIDKQQEGITRLSERAEKLRIKGDAIYAHFIAVQEVLETVTKARSGGLPWVDIIKRIDEGKEQGIPSALLIQKIVPSQAEIIVKLDDVEVHLDIRHNVQDNASMAYDQSKKARRKITGATTQIEKTKIKLEKVEEDFVAPIAKSGPIRIRKKHWYEKFRWFTSSDGFLVLGGRDVKTNEILAKKHMNANDVFLHAAMHGAPYVIIKVPEEPPTEKTLQEAAQFAISFSRAWQDGLSGGDAYWLNPEQVSFTPPSGEYLPSGSVMLRGTKNYIKNIQVKLALGLILEDDYAIAMSGPPSAIETNCEYYLEITPGDKKKGSLVKEIVSKLKSQVPEEKQHLVEQIPQEELM
ncbi:MAG: ribosome rescue protein RqcH, partial [Candidatus Thorarchaeota archaeon]